MTDRIALAVTPVPPDDARDDFASTLRRVDPDAGVFTVGELGHWRGDGVFESISVVDGRAIGVRAHVARLIRSALLSDLGEPHRAQWEQAARTAAAACGPGQWAMKLVLLRAGTAAQGTAWVSAEPAPDHTRVRHDGVRVITLDRGLTSDAAERSPWLLRGAKTLSYAVNVAAVREARRRGADEVLFVSTDGVVLEGATSSVILRRDGRFVTPTARAGVLPGTTQAALFAHLRARGATVSTEVVPAATLPRTDAAWLVSSVRLAVPVVALDDRMLAVDRELTASFNAYLLEPRD